MAQYSTKDGDTLDEIAYRYYGYTYNKVVENIIEANFGITDYPAILPAGVLNLLPAFVFSFLFYLIVEQLSRRSMIALTRKLIDSAIVVR